MLCSDINKDVRVKAHVPSFVLSFLNVGMYIASYESLYANHRLVESTAALAATLNKANMQLHIYSFTGCSIYPQITPIVSSSQSLIALID